MSYHERADFTVNEKYIFEIGGKNKNKTQIKGLENAFVVQDDIAFGVENTIPLWLFGLLYWIDKTDSNNIVLFQRIELKINSV